MATHVSKQTKLVRYLFSSYRKYLPKHAAGLRYSSDRVCLIKTTRKQKHGLLIVFPFVFFPSIVHAAIFQPLGVHFALLLQRAREGLTEYRPFPFRPLSPVPA